MARKKGTSTSNFGVGKRESHDASAFYERFDAPKIEKVKDFRPDPTAPGGLHVGDSTDMHHLAANSVALVVTSPPYFAGKQYEEEFEREGVPASYLEYLQMLHDVFAECRRVLEPGGRIAVNVANLGRKPYRSLSADIIHILQDELGFLLRGEVIWRKSEGSNGNCAWGSYRSAANPVLRDVTERVIIASKGQLQRAMDNKERASAEPPVPHRNTQLTDDFLASTLDVWDIQPESARRVEHPAPFPVELPLRLINLYTYENDLVLDPFLGSGSTAVAAAQSDRRYAGYDLDPAYVEIAERRVAEATASSAPASGTDPVAIDEGKASSKLALQRLTEAGFVDIADNKKIRSSGVAVDFVATDAAGDVWYFDVGGAFMGHRGGLLRNDLVWRALGRATALRGRRPDVPIVLLTSHLPRHGSEGDAALRSAGPSVIHDVIGLLSTDDLERLRSYAEHGYAEAQPGFWTPKDLAGATDHR